MARLVVLTGTLEINQVFGSTTGSEQVIKNALANQGFDVVSVRLTQQVFAVSVVGNITIECNVDDQYTAEQVRESALNVITSIPNSWWAFGEGAQMFTNVNLQILSDGKPSSAGSDATLDTMLNNIVSGTGKIITQGASNITSNIGTPIALAVIAAIAIIFLVPSKR